MKMKINLGSRRCTGTPHVVKGSSQHKALIWLSSHFVKANTCGNRTQSNNSNGNSNNNGNVNNGDYYYYYDCTSLLSRNELINRYVLATVYFAWNGKYWSDSNNSISSDNKSNNWLPSSTSPTTTNDNNICNWNGVTCRLQLQQHNTTTNVLDNNINNFDDDNDDDDDE